MHLHACLGTGVVFAQVDNLIVEGPWGQAFGDSLAVFIGDLYLVANLDANA